MKKNKGLFITLEGIEGAGKSTHMDYIAGLLKSTGKRIVCTREPGGTELGNELRNILLFRKSSHQISEQTELLLMFAARQQHLDEVIRPALKAGKIVLCDRFTDSTYAYQGGGRKIKPTVIGQLARVVHPDINPDLTLLFDLPVKLGLERANNRSEKDSFESEEKTFFERVRKTYLKIAKAEPRRVKVINAAKDIETVQSMIRKILKNKKLC
jgi:dTMP kinase